MEVEDITTYMFRSGVMNKKQIYSLVYINFLIFALIFIFTSVCQY